MAIYTPTPHRGTDIAELSSSTVSAPAGIYAGSIAVWTGTEWTLPPGTPMPSPTIGIVNSWANSIAVADNDLIYLRKKNGIIYVMKAEPHKTGTWEKLDPTAVPVITDMHGAKLEEEGQSLADLRDKLVGSYEPIDMATIPSLEIGWYQDQKAELFYYEGEGHWREVDLKTNKKLFEMASTGILEFIG